MFRGPLSLLLATTSAYRARVCTLVLAFSSALKQNFSLSHLWRIDGRSPICLIHLSTACTCMVKLEHGCVRKIKRRVDSIYGMWTYVYTRTDGQTDRQTDRQNLRWAHHVGLAQARPNNGIWDSCSDRACMWRGVCVYISILIPLATMIDS